MTTHGDESIAYAAKQQERIVVTFLALAWLFVLLRIWTRTWIISNFGWDDATMIFANVRDTSDVSESIRS
jgi:lipoprotein signal peptidase